MLDNGSWKGLKRGYEEFFDGIVTLKHPDYWKHLNFIVVRCDDCRGVACYGSK